MKIRENVDIINFFIGREDSFEVTEEQKEFAHNLIDDGVDIILGHHPHKFQGIEIYEGKPIVCMETLFLIKTTFKAGIIYCRYGIYQ